MPLYINLYISIYFLRINSWKLHFWVKRYEHFKKLFKFTFQKSYTILHWSMGLFQRSLRPRLSLRRDMINMFYKEENYSSKCLIP